MATNTASASLTAFRLEASLEEMLTQSGRLLEKTALLSASVAFEGVALACADSAPMAAKVSQLLEEASAALEAAERAEEVAVAAAADSSGTQPPPPLQQQQQQHVDADWLAETQSGGGGGGATAKA